VKSVHSVLDLDLGGLDSDLDATDRILDAAAVDKLDNYYNDPYVVRMGP
jgi:hypothetical protein